MAEAREYEGGCHCGAVRFKATTDLAQVIECNCSHCRMKGFVLTFTPVEQFELTAGADGLTEYRFNKKVLAHQFCKVCGVQPHAFGSGPDGKKMAAINLRCVDGLDLATLTPFQYNGADI